MQRKLIALGTTLAVLLLLLLAPRFGWGLEGGTGEYFRISSVNRESGMTTLVYKSRGHALSISYGSRFARDFTAQYDSEAPVSFMVEADGGILGEQGELSNPFLMSGIVWKDISGIFYYRYLLCLALLVLGWLALTKPNAVKIGNQNFYAMPMFIALLIAMRTFL